MRATMIVLCRAGFVGRSSTSSSGSLVDSHSLASPPVLALQAPGEVEDVTEREANSTSSVPEPADKGSRVAVREGGKTIAAGTVTKLLH